MFLLAPFEYEFFRNGFIAAVLGRRAMWLHRGLRCVAPHELHRPRTVPCYFRRRRIELCGQHQFFFGAGLWSLLAAFLIHRISHRRWVGADAAIGVVTTSSFAFGVAIVSTYRSFTRNIEAALFGNILGITPRDLWIVASISIDSFRGAHCDAPAVAVSDL